MIAKISQNQMQSDFMGNKAEAEAIRNQGIYILPVASSLGPTGVSFPFLLAHFLHFPLSCCWHINAPVSEMAGSLQV